MVYCLSEKPESIFIPVLFPPIAEKKEVLKEICLFLKTPKWSSHSLSVPIFAIPVSKRKQLR